MKRIMTIMLVVVLMLTVVACSPTTDKPGGSEGVKPTVPTETADKSPNEPSDPERFTCIVSESAAGVPFSQLTWRGFEKIRDETGAKVQFVEALEAAEFEEQLRAMAELGASPIYSMFDAVNLVAADIAHEYPEVQFILIDCNEQFDIPNVTSIIVDSYEPSFVAGLVAALTTEKAQVGWVGCLDIPVITRFYDGFAAGIDYANETYNLNVQVEKVYIGDAEDTVKGAESARLLIDKGVDVIYHAANEAGLGVIQACVEANVKCIGVDEWQGYIDELVFWSALIAIDNAVYDSYDRFISGALEPGEINYGISTDSPIFDARDYERLPDSIKGAVDVLMQGVHSGDIDLFDYER